MTNFRVLDPQQCQQVKTNDRPREEAPPGANTMATRVVKGSVHQTRVNMETRTVGPCFWTQAFNIQPGKIYFVNLI